MVRNWYQIAQGAPGAMFCASDLVYKTLINVTLFIIQHIQTGSKAFNAGLRNGYHLMAIEGETVTLRDEKTLAVMLKITK